MNSLDRLRRGEAVFGLMQTYPVPAVTELMLWCGYDFVIIDCEHGVVDEAAQVDALRVFGDGTAFSIVRIRGQDPSAVARYLDFGAAGIMVPDVRTPAQAEGIAFVALKRWTGGLRSDRYGLPPATAAGPRPLIIVLIEHPDGVANIEAIVDVEGIDAVVIGTGDLSTQLGVPGDFQSPIYRSAVDRVEDGVRARGKILGAKPEKHAPLAELFARGHRLFLVGRDMPMFRRALTDTLRAASAEISGL
jgi:2-keto-3-deoxy-L-rhamnonate aldolase RhmA